MTRFWTLTSDEEIFQLVWMPSKRARTLISMADSDDVDGVAIELT